MPKQLLSSSNCRNVCEMFCCWSFVTSNLNAAVSAHSHTYQRYRLVLSDLVSDPDRILCLNSENSSLRTVLLITSMVHLLPVSPPESRPARRSPSVWTAGSSGVWPADLRCWWPRPQPEPEPDDWTKAEGTAWESYDVLCKYIRGNIQNLNTNMTFCFM